MHVCLSACVIIKAPGTNISKIMANGKTRDNKLLDFGKDRDLDHDPGIFAILNFFAQCKLCPHGTYCPVLFTAHWI